MDNTMNEYYEVLQYLREIKVDRQYPYEFQNQSKLTYDGSVKVDLSDENVSVHDYSIVLQDIKAGNSLIVTLPKPRNYDNVNKCDMNIISPTNTITNATIEVGISNSKYAIPLTTTLEPTTYTLPPNTHDTVTYNIFKDNTTPLKKNRKVGDIYSVKLTFTEDIGLLYISDIVFRTINYNITLETLDYNIKSGEDYIRTQLYLAEVSNIPPTLSYLCYKSAAAYSWITWWENEGKAMNDGTVNGENYASRLFEQIDQDISKYIEANPVSITDQINTDMIGYTWVEGARKHKPHCRHGVNRR